MRAQKAPARACLLILPLAHGVFGATAAAEVDSQKDTVLLQFGASATTDEVVSVDSAEVPYLLVSVPQLASDARSGCPAGYGLAMPKSAEETASLLSVISGSSTNFVWAGAKIVSGQWTWDDGSPMGPYSNWYDGYFVDASYPWLAIGTDDGVWYDWEGQAVELFNIACQADAVSGTGDPHLSNLRGEHFDVYQPGSMALLHLPRLADPVRTLLLVEADARRVGDVCSVYFQVVSISGLWTNQSTPITFFANPHGAPEGRRWKEWMRFGPIDLKVVRRTKGVDYLNVYARNIGHSGYEVGGLLGLDDHAAVAKRPRECAHRRAAALWSSDAKAI